MEPIKLPEWAIRERQNIEWAIKIRREAESKATGGCGGTKQDMIAYFIAHLFYGWSYDDAKKVLERADRQMQQDSRIYCLADGFECGLENIRKNSLKYGDGTEKSSND